MNNKNFIKIVLLGDGMIYDFKVDLNLNRKSRKNFNYQ